MIKTVLFAFLVLMTHAVSAEMCNSPLDPSTWTKPDTKASEIYIHVMPHPTLGGNAIVLGWPTVTPGKICCNVSHFDPGTWQNIFTGAQGSTPAPLTTFVAGLPAPPWSSRAMDYPWAVTACENMANALVAGTAPVVTPPPAVPAVYIIVASISGQTSRPLYDGGFATIGRVEFLLNGAPRVCEPTPIVYKAGSTVKYYWVTNNAGQRGLAVCKLA